MNGSQTVAAGGSVCIFATADILLSNIVDAQSFVSIQTANDITSYAAPYYQMSAIGGSITINSQVSISLSNSNFTSCSATAIYTGTGNVSLAAIGGAVLFSSNLNNFAFLLRAWLTKPCRYTLTSAIFNSNSASAVRGVAPNAATLSTLTVLGGAVTILRSDNLNFCSSSSNPSVSQNQSCVASNSSISQNQSCVASNSSISQNQSCVASNSSVSQNQSCVASNSSISQNQSCVASNSSISQNNPCSSQRPRDQNYNHYVSISGTVFSSNTARAAFPKQASDPTMPSTANSVVLGGSLCVPRMMHPRCLFFCLVAK